MSLHHLSTELLSLILQSLDSPRDFLSLIIASRPCYATYSNAPSLFITSLLRNAIHPAAMHHALAALHAPLAKPPQPDTLAFFVERYFTNDSFEFPTDLAGLKQLCRLYNRTSFFIHDDASHAMRLILAPSPSSTVDENLHLTETERARFQRAFFRYEVYCLAFPPSARQRHHVCVWQRYEVHPFFRAQSQFRRFMSPLKALEVEEMSCVHFYLTGQVVNAFKSVEDQLIKDVLSIPARRRNRDSRQSSVTIFDSYLAKLPPEQLPDVAATIEEVAALEEVDTASEDFIDMTPFRHSRGDSLNLFSTSTRPRANATFGFFASLGLSWLYRLVDSNVDQRRSIIREFFEPKRDFLPKAIRVGNNDVVDATEARDSGNHDQLRAGTGYHLFKRQSEERYLPIENGFEHCPLRERAYVFWNSNRISQARVAHGFTKAASIDQPTAGRHYDLYWRFPVEERLHMVCVPRAERAKIQEKFGCPREFRKF